MIKTGENVCASSIHIKSETGDQQFHLLQHIAGCRESITSTWSVKAYKVCVWYCRISRTNHVGATITFLTLIYVYQYGNSQGHRFLLLYTYSLWGMPPFPSAESYERPFCNKGVLRSPPPHWSTIFLPVLKTPPSAFRGTSLAALPALLTTPAPS